jgi:alpha-D-xyloside xylohydrolase
MRAGFAWTLAACATLVDCSSDRPEPPPVVVTSGEATIRIAGGGGTLTLAQAGTELLQLSMNDVELGTLDALDDTRSYDPYWLEYAPPGAEPDVPPDLVWRKPELGSWGEGEPGARIELRFGGGLDFVLTIRPAAPGRFALHLQPIDESTLASFHVAYIRLRPRTLGDEKEGFYGLGEWEDTVDHRGKLRPMQIEADGDLESANNEAHVPVPLLLGTRGWGIFVESKRVGLFDVARKDPKLVEITYGTAEQTKDGLRFHLFAEKSPLDLTRHYYEVTSFPRIPAPWALGPWIWRDENKDQAQVLEDIQKIRELDLATSAIWIDRPYATAVNTFDFDQAKFPDPAGMIRAIYDAGLRLALWSTPYLEKSAEPLRSEAEQKKYFPPKTSIPLNKWSEPIDFTNREAYKFWFDQVSKYTSAGIEGFKLDYAEDIVPSLRGGRNAWRFADGTDERTMHYGYTLLYHQLYASTLQKGSSFVLARAGRWGDQANVDVIWPGDMDATFTKHRERFKDASGKEITGVGGLPATIVMGVGLGPSGFPFFGADTGGYRHSPPDKELFIRWFEQTALSTVMQVGDSSSQPPWEFTPDNGRDQETLDLYRRYARLHMRLFPYEWTYAQRIAKDGRPIQRPLGLAYPELGVHPSDEYLFGEELLVAPVVERGARERRAVVPPGEWIDWWDGTPYAGGAAPATIPAPLEKLPLLVRAGSCVPMLRPTIDAIAPTTRPASEVDSFANDPGVLWVRVVPSASGKAVFEVWDGARTEASLAGARLEIATRGGATFRAGQMLEIVRTKAPASVTIGAAPLLKLDSRAALEAASSGWFWEPSTGGTLWVRAPAGEQRIVVE